MRTFSFALVALMTIAASSFAQEKAKEQAKDAGPAPTFADVSYGPHERNVLDFYQAKGDGPRPLLVYIHGGGWTSGDKKQPATAFQPFLEKGVSYAAINYRLSGQAPLPAPVHDAARAIQFIRTKAKEWNINTQRIALTGGSAGACTSMWILLHDDLADPNATDPVLRQSTRVAAAAVSAGQTSIDPKVIEPWLGPMVLQHRMINLSVGEPTIEGALKNYDQHHAIYVEFSPYNHVDKNDPPLFMTYGNNMKLPSENAGHGIHHPVYGVKLKEKSDKAGHECHLLIPGVSKSEKYATANDFLMAKLLTEVALNAADKKETPFRELPQGAGKIDADAAENYTETKSGLKYRILRQGDGKKPTADNTVEVNYEGWLDNGSVFDSSYKRNESISFPLGRVIPGWTEGMQLVGTGGMIELEIPAKLGYGDRGAPPVIPGGATLHFLVELIKVQ